VRSRQSSGAAGRESLFDVVHAANSVVQNRFEELHTRCSEASDVNPLAYTSADALGRQSDQQRASFANALW
jgi:hypothetical protein